METNTGYPLNCSQYLIVYLLSQSTAPLIMIQFVSLRRAEPLQLVYLKLSSQSWKLFSSTSKFQHKVQRHKSSSFLPNMAMNAFAEFRFKAYYIHHISEHKHFSRLLSLLFLSALSIWIERCLNGECMGGSSNYNDVYRNISC